MKCHLCDEENSPLFNFCEHCGNRFPEHCTDCGSTLGVHCNYCENCGVKLSEKIPNKDSDLLSNISPNIKSLSSISHASDRISNVERFANERPSLEDRVPNQAEYQDISLSTALLAESATESQAASVSKKLPIVYTFDLSSLQSCSDDRVYVTGKLPPVQVTNAIEKYALGANFEDVLVLADSTLRKNGREGFLLTSTTLYGQTPFVEPRKINLQDIQSLAFKKGFMNAYLMINGEEFTFTTTFKKEVIDCFIASLNKALNLKV